MGLHHVTNLIMKVALQTCQPLTLTTNTCGGVINISMQLLMTWTVFGWDITMSWV